MTVVNPTRGSFMSRMRPASSCLSSSSTRIVRRVRWDIMVSEDLCLVGDDAQLGLAIKQGADAFQRALHGAAFPRHRSDRQLAALPLVEVPGLGDRHVELLRDAVLHAAHDEPLLFRSEEHTSELQSPCN